MNAPPPRPDDAALLARLQAREPAAFEALVRTHGGRMLSVARRIMGVDADAQDAVQEAFVNAFKALGSFHGEARLSTWLHRIVVNACLMKLRSRKRKPEEPIDDLLPRFQDDGHHEIHPLPWTVEGDVAMERAEVRGLVRAAIERLPESYRTVLVLRDIEERDTAEVAAALGLTEGTVKTRLHRARQALKTLLDPHFRGSAA